MVNISVIIPVYNAEPYLRDCLNSIISQELENLEVICINDGSWDKSQEILAEYSWKYPYIKIVEQTNRGAFAARNLGMQLAKGEYVCFIDADDYYPDSFVLSEMFYAAKENNALICGGSFQEDRPSEKIDEWSGNLSRYKFNTDGFIEYKNYQFEYGYHRFIYKKDFIKKQGILFPDLSYYEDPVFFVTAMSEAKKFYALQRITYCYRTLHKTSLWSDKQVLDLLTGIKLILNLAKEQGFTELMVLERARIENDYLDPILKFLLKDKNETLLKLLNELNNILFNNGQRLEYYMFKRKLEYINYDCCINSTNTEKKIKVLQQENEQLSKELEKKDASIQEYITTLQNLSESNIVLKASIQNQENHFCETYKILQQKEQQSQLAIETLQHKIVDIYESTTWQVGNCLLAIPKIIKNNIKKRKNR